MENNISAITLDKVAITGGYGIINLSQLHIESVPNEHAIAIVKGVINAEVGVQKLKSELENSIINIRQINDNRDEEYIPIFSGYVDEIDIMQAEYDYFLVEIKLISGSYKLDVKKKSRSFQDISNTYEDVLNALMNYTNGGQIRCSFKNDCSIKKPLIQYNETDWEFIKRIASYQNCSIIPELEWGLPRIYAGVEKNNNVRFCEKDFIKGVSGKFYELGGFEEGYNKEDFIYYKVKSYKNCNIGTEANIDGKSLIICEKRAEFIRGELIFSYVIGSEILLTKRKYFNENIVGNSIIGTVLKTEGETVKLHLDIDKSQDEGTAYPYKWVPQTGNIMYCMPKVKSRVSLYFGDSDEQKAVAINCVRENGESCSEFSDYNNKYLTTEHNKRLAMTPSTINFIGDITNSNSSKFELIDDISITFKSNSKMIIITSAKIKMNSKEINIIAPLEIIMNQGGNTGLTINNNVDIKTPYDVVVINDNCCEYTVFGDAPVEVEFNWLELGLKVLAAAVIVAAAIAVTALTFGLAGPVIVGAAVGGAVAIGCVAAGDAISGNVSSLEEYLKQGLVGAVVGGLCSGLGLLNSSGKAISVFGLAPLKLGFGKIGFITGVTETLLDFGWRGISPSYDVDAGEFALNGLLNVAGGVGGGFVGEILDNAKRFKITQAAKLLDEFSNGGSTQLHTKLRDLAAKYGVLTNPQLSSLFGVGSKAELKALLNGLPPKERLKLFLETLPGLASDIEKAKAFEGAPANIIAKELSNLISSALIDDGSSQRGKGSQQVIKNNIGSEKDIKGLEVQYEKK